MMSPLFNIVSYTAVLKYSDKGLQSAISIGKGSPSWGMKSMESTSSALILIRKLSVTTTEVSDFDFLKLQDVNIVADANKQRNNGKITFFMIFL
jgi:hypothetical protein